MTDTPPQMVLDVAAADTRLNRDSFFEAPCNAHALHSVLDWRAWDGVPRVLNGLEGAGKTHLAYIFAQDAQAPILQARSLTDQSIPAVITHPALVLEDAHCLSDRPEAQSHAFHLFNQARDLGQAFLITGRGPVRDWGLSLPDLSSRLTATAQITITNPDEDTLRMVLIKLFSDRQLAVPAEAIEYTVHRMERSFSAAAALVAALDEANLRENRRITKPMIREIITILSQGKPLQGGPE